MTKINIPFRPKQVYYQWHILSKGQWKLDDDPLTSAQKFIEDHGEEHMVSLLSIQEEPGTRVLAFEVTDFMKQWAHNTQELAMDSTCQ